MEIRADEVREHEFNARFQEALNAYWRRDFSEAMLDVEDAEKVKPPTVETLNLRGAIHAERGEFEKARVCFEKAQAMNAAAFWPRFNLAEILLMQRRSADALEAFEKLRTTGPDGELVEFKIILALLRMVRDDEALARLKALAFPSESGAPYFAWAAWEFAHAHPIAAHGWIRKANAAFNPNSNVIYYDSLADMGWVEKRPSK